MQISNTAVTSTAAGRCALWGFAVGVVLAGCTAMPPLHRQASLPMPTPVQAETAPAVQRVNQRILGAYGGVYRNARLQQMVENLVKRLVAASGEPNLKYRVILLNSPAINAFAVPDGHIYVTRGLIALASDESELASVLAHEMGHVIAHHAQLRAEEAQELVQASRAIAMGDPQIRALALVRSERTLAAFSRAQEFEADDIGVGIIARAGLDPYAASRMLADMQRKADFNGDGRHHGSVDFLATHPSTPARIRKAIADARSLSESKPGQRERHQYLADIDGMIYGEDPSEGYVRGRRFIHAKLGFTFLAPPGFVLDNTEQALLGMKAGKLEALRLDAVNVPAGQSLSDYIKSGWNEYLDPASVEKFTLNGFPAASARANGKTWSYYICVVRFGTDVYRFIFAAKHMTRQVDASFRQSIDTFRRMSLKEAAEVKPLHIKVITVGPHDTVATLARRIALPDHRIERFRVLNGLGPADQVKPGSEVKIVVE